MVPIRTDWLSPFRLKSPRFDCGFWIATDRRRISRQWIEHCGGIRLRSTHCGRGERDHSSRTRNWYGNGGGGGNRTRRRIFQVPGIKRRRPVKACPGLVPEMSRVIPGPQSSAGYAYLHSADFEQLQGAAPGAAPDSKRLRFGDRSALPCTLGGQEF